MMTKTFLRFTLTALIGAAIISGCASSSDTARERAFTPEWYDDSQTAEDEEFVYGYGTATTPSMTSSRNQADLQARSRLAQYYEERLERMVQQGTQTLDETERQLKEEAARALARETISGVKVDRIERYKADNGQIQTFIRVRVPVESVAEQARSVVSEMDMKLDEMEDASE